VELLKITKDTGKICAYCGKEITDEGDLTLDHVVPLSKGGKNSSDNLVIACKACNGEKSNLDVDKYSRFIKIMSLMTQNNDNGIITDTIGGLKEIVKNFNDELKELKKRKSARERKRTAVLESMMYEKFNVVRGYDYAKLLRDLTEEIYNLSLTIAQMNAVFNKLSPAFAFLNNTEPETIKKNALKDMRNSVISNYYNSQENDKPKEQPSLSGLIEKSEIAEPKAQ